VVAALAGAACCAGAAALTWWTARYADALVGEVTTSAKGSDLLPELVPVALLALAGVGATVATRGWPRRLIGALVVVGGLLVVVRAVAAMTGAPEVLQTALTRPASRVGVPELHPAGPVIAVAGGLLIALGGVLVVVGAGRAKGMGARYDAPARRAARARTAADEPGALWQALDAGADPTARDPDDAGPTARDPDDAGPTARDPDDAGPTARDPDSSVPGAGPETGPDGPVTDTHPGRIP
jgi:uncharacterized membrane protein (TIGR02234 family)